MRNYQKGQQGILKKAGLMALVVVFGFSIVILHLPLSFAEEKPQLSTEQINQNFGQIRKAGGYFKASYICTLLSAGAMAAAIVYGEPDGFELGISVGAVGSIASIILQWLAADKLAKVLTPAIIQMELFKEKICRIIDASEFSLKNRYNIPLKMSYFILPKENRIRISISSQAFFKKEQLENLKGELMVIAHEIAVLCQEEARRYDFNLAILQKPRGGSYPDGLPRAQTTPVFSKSLSFDEALTTQLK